MIFPKKLQKGDTIGVVAPSNPIIGENIQEIEKAKEIIEKLGFKVKYSKNLFSNTNGYEIVLALDFYTYALYRHGRKMRP